MASLKERQTSPDKAAETSLKEVPARQETKPSIPVARGERNQTFFPSAEEFFANPLGAMRRIHEDMDRLFAQAWSRGPAGNPGREELTLWSPAIEMKQQGDNLLVSAELPGLKPEEVQIEATGDALVIQGERRQEHASSEGAVHHTERSYGRFYRAIPLPEGADADRANAVFRDGVLEVSIPYQPREPRRREIPISRGGSRSAINEPHQ